MDKIAIILLTYNFFSVITSSQTASLTHSREVHNNGFTYPSPPSKYQEACLKLDREYNCLLCHGFEWMRNNTKCSFIPLKILQGKSSSYKCIMTGPHKYPKEMLNSSILC